jgi:protein-disulfide isomerase
VSKQARTLSREVRQARALAEQRARRRRRLLVGGGAIVILGLVVAIAVSLISAAGDDEPSPAAGPVVVPAGATADGGLTVGSADAPVLVEVFLDYMCPFCGRFERANGAELDRLLADGTARLELHLLSFLDEQSSGTRYSTRAANAVATVADRAPDRLLAFHAALYANQPEEGSRGLGDDRIADLARGAGVPDNVVSTFSERTFEPWIVRVTEAAFSSGITGTPTVRINGKPFEGDLYTAGPLTAAVREASDR